ncbi:MAG: DNA-deoxyinosine glycosylase [Ruminococcus sp.]|nr:DNA-deoxyinosine glycosylase [Candidatus Apopatosoma intestinale]
MTVHPIPPVYDEKSEILILGSFPSVRSREIRFFYGHPQNRFWRVLASLYGCPVPQTTEGKKTFLRVHRIALWDVIASCEIEGSADSTIRNVTPNDLSAILSSAPIRQIFVNGKTAETYYRRYTEPLIHRPAVCLPSTSPANAAWPLDRLTEKWKEILSVHGENPAEPAENSLYKNGSV